MMYMREYSKRHPTERNKYWCVNCQCFIEISEMLGRLLDDDQTTEKRCPGCDLVLLEVVDEPQE